MELRDTMLKAAKRHAEAHIEKHKANVEIYLSNPVGVGEHSDVMDEIEKQVEEMAKYKDILDILNEYF